MEDAHSAVIGIPEVGDNLSWFAVFDGHAGSRVSAHCSAHLLECISSTDDFRASLKKENQLSEDELMDKVSIKFDVWFNMIVSSRKKLVFLHCSFFISAHVF